MKISVIKNIYLEKCFESIFSQDFDSFEVVAVDDGSTDDSGAVCDRWAKKEERLHVIHTPNGGVTSARRQGVEHAEGLYIMFVDADDGLEANALQTMYDAISTNDADEVIAPFRTFQGVESPIVHEGFVPAEPLIKDIISSKNRFPVLWSIIFRRELLADTLDTPREIIEGEDKLMQVKVLMKQPRVFFIKDYIYRYNLGLPNSRRHTLERERLYDQLLRKILAPRKEVFHSSFTLHQLKEYERFIHDGHSEVRSQYYKEAIGTMPADIPIYDRVVFFMHPLLARPVIKLYRKLITFKQKGL